MVVWRKTLAFNATYLLGLADTHSLTHLTCHSVLLKPISFEHFERFDLIKHLKLKQVDTLDLGLLLLEFKRVWIRSCLIG